MSLRILHVISSVNPSGGGPIEGLKRIASVDVECGRSVEVVCLDAPSDDWVKGFPVPCHALGPGTIGNYRYSAKLVPWLRANRHRYDAVFVNGIWQYHTFAAWRALSGTETPYFVFTHGMLDPWFKRRYPLKHLKKWVFWPWSEYRVLRDAAAVLFTCENERLLAKESFWLYRCKESVISYGTSRPPSGADEQRALFSEKFSALHGKRQLLFLGRVHEKKGPDLLFRAFASLRDRCPEKLSNVHIVMAGPNDHEYGREMQELVAELRLSDSVTWTGMLTGDMKWGAFRSAEAFILPSHQENFGIAVAEAMACGIPVLISDQVNIWREIAEAGAGFVEPDTLDGTERLIQRWLDTQPSAWRDMGLKAEQCFNDRFTVERTAESVVGAYMAVREGHA